MGNKTSREWTFNSERKRSESFRQTVLVVLNYRVRVDPGMSEQFCCPFDGLIGTAPFPVSWRIVVVGEEVHHGLEHVR